MARKPEPSPFTIPSGLAARWLAAMRPKTLSLSLGPVVLALMIAISEGQNVPWFVSALILIAVLCIQIATNLWNDAADAASGLDDRATRLGPPRMTSLGLLRPIEVRIASFAFLALAALCGLWLIHFGGWPIFAIGAMGIICALLYSSGPYPIAASPFGECLVLIFFGLLAVAGSHYLLTGMWSSFAFLAGFYAGLPAAGVLTINNHRDREGDIKGGRKTLAILLGHDQTQHFYMLIMSLSAFGPWHLSHFSTNGLLISCLLLVVVWLIPIRALRHIERGQGLNKVLAQTAAFQMLWIALFGIVLFA
ncbi:MAG: 1,4-dihydroxy-2-naphthoate octaprenyltransferase [Cohaesibacter sp.]|nr:1,4-dihydroxy-2-naphthoate octaprenyltransferase [Cohaesibacter sp.]